MKPAFTFKTVHRAEADDWTLDGSIISAPDKLAVVKTILETTGPVLVEHWHFYGSRAPDRQVIDDFAEFIKYLQENAIAGDAIHVWNLHDLLREDNQLVQGKCPAEDGTVPQKGAY